jgi:hypothetical protein
VRRSPAAHGPDWTCPARPAHANQAMQNAAAAGILAGFALLVAAIVMGIG